MAINERLVHTASAGGSGAAEAEQGLILHLDANDVDSYDGDGPTWYDISEYNVTIPLSDNAANLELHLNASDATSYSGTGTTWTDLTSNNNATVVASTYDIDNGGYFDITSNTVTFSSNTSALDTTTFSFEMWVYQTTTSGTQYLFSDTGISLFTISGTQMRFVKGLSGTNNDTAYFNPTSNGSGWATNKWNHIAVTFSSYTSSIYINGVLVDAESEGSGTGTALTTLQISPSDGRWKGYLGAFRVYDIALSASEVGQNYRHGRDYVYTELVTTTPVVWSGFQNAVTSITSDSTATVNAPGTADTATTHSIFDISNSFNMGNNGTTEANNEIFITLNAPKSIKGFAVYEYYNSNYRYTGTTKLYGSTDNNNWYLLGSTVQNVNINYNRNETTFAATPEYQYYKFTLSANSRGTYQGAWALELIADFDVTPSLHLDPASYSGTGTTWTADAGNDGTLVGDTSYDQELGDFFDLDGTGDHISLDSSGYLTGNFTIEMWWNFDSLGGYQMLWGPSGYRDGTGLGHFILGDKIRTFISVSGSLSNIGESDASLVTGKWHHIVLTRDGNVYTQYLDGIKKSFQNSTVSLESANTYIGAHYNDTIYNVNGKVGQVRVYNSALSEGAIRQNYNFTKPSYPNGNHGTLSGGLSSSDWNSSGYFSLDGSSDYIQIPTNASYASATHWSVAMWINPISISSDEMLATLYGSGSDQKFDIRFGSSSGDIRFIAGTSSGGFDSGQDLTSATALSTSTWHHLVCVYDDTNDKMFIYIDGSLDATETTANDGTYTSITDPILIGKRTDGYHSNIKISDFKFYDKALASSEVTAEYNKGQFGAN